MDEGAEYKMTDMIENTINKFPVGMVFTADDFPATAENPKWRKRKRWWRKK
jgi:hypothetical protein